MCASFEVLATICIRELIPATNDLISFCLLFRWEPFVKCAGVDQKGGFGNFFVFLTKDVRLHIRNRERMTYNEIIRDNDERWVRDDGNLDNIFECEIKSVPSCDNYISGVV